MEFITDRTDNLTVSDKEIFGLPSKVYVEAGFASDEVAKTIFDPVKVRARGLLFSSREVTEDRFCGMVIVVPPKSQAIVRAVDNECEMHLLGVDPKYRQHGLGRQLVQKAIEFANNNNWSKMVLWTQKPMKAAQNLYESLGFIRTGEMLRNDIEFFVYEKDLSF